MHTPRQIVYDIMISVNCRYRDRRKFKENTNCQKFAMQHQHVTWTVDILFIYICKNVAIFQFCYFAKIRPCVLQPPRLN